MGASYNPRFLVNTTSPIITADWCSSPEARQRVDNLNHPSWVLVIHPLFSRMSYSPIPTPIIALESQYILRVYTSFLPGA